MSRAKKFIKDCTRHCSNELCAVEDRFGKKVISYHEWLSPEQALMAVEIAREEIKAEIERLIKSYSPIWSSEGKYRIEAYKELLEWLDTTSMNDIQEEYTHEDLEKASQSYSDKYNDDCFDAIGSKCTHIIDAFKAGAQWQKEQKVLNDNNKEYHRVPSTTLKRLYMNEAKYELLKSDIIEGIVGDFEKGTTHNYLTIKIPMLLCPSNCAKGDKVKLIIIKEE